jgi:hypothetical protein
MSAGSSPPSCSALLRQSSCLPCAHQPNTTEMAPGFSGQSCAQSRDTPPPRRSYNRFPNALQPGRMLRMSDMDTCRDRHAKLHRPQCINIPQAENRGNNATSTTAPRRLAEAMRNTPPIEAGGAQLVVERLCNRTPASVHARDDLQDRGICGEAPPKLS